MEVCVWCCPRCAHILTLPLLTYSLNQHVWSGCCRCCELCRQRPRECKCSPPSPASHSLCLPPEAIQPSLLKHTNSLSVPTETFPPTRLSPSPLSACILRSQMCTRPWRGTGPPSRMEQSLCPYLLRQGAHGMWTEKFACSRLIPRLHYESTKVKALPRVELDLFQPGFIPPHSRCSNHTRLLTVPTFTNTFLPQDPCSCLLLYSDVSSVKGAWHLQLS